MKIKTREVADMVIIELSDKLMGGPDGDTFHEVLVRHIDAGYRKILIHLGQVTWVNSIGLGMLVGGYTTARNRQADLHLCCLSERIQNIFSITKLAQVFKIYETEADALNDFKR